MLSMKNWLNNYFSFTKREYNGLLVLMAILLAVSVLPYLYSGFFIRTENNTLVEKNALQKLVFVNQQQTADSYTKIRTQIEDNESLVRSRLFKFDPNQINVEQWQQLGLSPKQAQSIINYRSKGGRFYKTEDLQKMYTISPKKYQELAPYVSIENSGTTYPSKKQTYSPQPSFEKKELVIVEINSADTLQLDEIKGIGAAFARRIVKYRDKLGGFYKKEQLMEVYGLDSVKYNEIKDQIKLNTSIIHKININTATFDDLKNHPYLKYKQINAIIQYRKQHGRYINIEDLKKVIILDPQLIQQLTPYLTF